MLHIYVFAKISFLPLFNKKSSRQKAVIFTGILTWIVYLISRIYRHSDFGIISALLEVAGMQWTASVFLLFVSFFISDIICGFGFFFKKYSGRIKSTAAVFGAVLIIIAHFQGLRPPVVQTEEVFLKTLPDKYDGITLAVLSDLHAGEMMIGSSWLNRRLGQVEKLNPDIIILAGDLFERRSNIKEIIPVMQRFDAPFGVWAVRGNHDTVRSGRKDVTGEILKKADIPLLSNENASPLAGLVIAGVDDFTSSRRHSGKAESDLETSLENKPEGAVILISHTPWMVKKAAASGVDLMISGHTHNGQIWPFNYLVKSQYPYITGRYTIDEMFLFVSKGTGTWGPRMRLWSPGEINFITLRKSE